MTIAAVIVITLGILFILLLFAALLNVSSRCSRRDEAYYLLHPPDEIQKAVKRPDGNTATGYQPDHDSSANRCVCCGDVIPEGKQVCVICEQRMNPDKAWW